ncbi:MAG TPA: hypothetical protein VHG69_11045 [Thermoleophilaceae bacterium]|nr:hypothetical protein [Thermoleophilaceae bacterium]
MPLICRHNRFTAECPICAKGTVLDQSRGASTPTRAPRSGAGPARRRAGAVAVAPEVKGPYGIAGPYEHDEGTYEVRLERVPGGLRLAAWAAGRIQRRAPVLAAADLPDLLASAAERGVLPEEEAREMLASSGDAVPGAEGFGRSPGRTGELRDELRVEVVDGGRLRVARWIERPGRGWELQEAPVMLPAARYAQALASAAERGALCR